MEIKLINPGLVILGFALAAVLAAVALIFRKRAGRKISLRAANTQRLRAHPLYRQKRLEGIAWRALLAAGLVTSLTASLFLAARPYQHNAVREKVTRRDIFLCMDISSSSCPGLSGFTEEFRRMVPDLEGDQVGISLFNTSAMQYVPVTEDYSFVSQRLDGLEQYFRSAEAFQAEFADKYDYVYEIPQDQLPRYEELNASLAAFDRGVTAGYEVKGTSVVGEGLAACLFSFPELRTETRSRIILLVTDNLPEYLDEPLATLEQVAEMCAYDGVTVYGIYPDIRSDDPEEAAKISNAQEQMKKAVESTGGAFYRMDSSFSAEQILADIRSRARAESRTVTSTTDVDTPEGWRRMLYAGLGLTMFLLLLMVLRLRGRIFGAWSLRRKLATSAVFLAAAACTVLIVVRPMQADRQEDIRTTNLDVCFAVDTTISMWAEDYDGGETRMSGVRKDITAIMDALPGSCFSLVRFDNGAQILAPYIQNISVIEECLDQISIPSYATAEGSTLNTVHDALADMVRASDEKAGVRKTVLFLMSDGEITDGSALMSFSDIGGGADDGAVLGYGTAAGGRMNYPGKGYIRDTAREKDALSVMDEENLKAVARDLGIKYVHSGEKEAGKLSRVLEGIRRMSRSTALHAGDRTGWKETYHYYAGILALILMICLFRLLNRGNLL
jgi:hypothetical protein